jgi:hypothetical protein
VTALDTVIAVPRRVATLERLAELATIATETVGPPATHLARYPAFVTTLQDAGVSTEAVPTLARDLVQHDGRTLIPSAVDQQLRLAVLGETDWEGQAPRCLAATAAEDRDALHQLAARILRMAAWQDIDLSRMAEPICTLGPLQARHEELLDTMGWTPPERAIPHARQALVDNPSLREVVLGPAVQGLVVWEVEELIALGRGFLEALGDGLPTIGIYLERGAVRRPYAESYELLPTLAAAGTDVIRYEELSLETEVERADVAAPRTGGEH